MIAKVLGLAVLAITLTIGVIGTPDNLKYGALAVGGALFGLAVLATLKR